MKKLNLGLLLDIARLARPTDSETLKLLKSRHGSRAPFTYNVARHTAMSLWAGDITLAAAEGAAAQSKMGELGKRCNLEVIRLIYEYSKPFNSMCRRIPAQPYPVSQDAFIPIPIDFYFSVDGVPKLFLLQPRRTHAPEDKALGLVAGIICDVYIPDIFEHAELYLLDLKSTAGVRIPRVLGFSDLPRTPQEEIRQLLQVYLEAYRMYEVWAAQQPKQNKEDNRKKPDGNTGQIEFPW